MAIRDLASHQNDNVVLDTSVCVIGAGMAGLIVAQRLAKSGINVVLLESGDRHSQGEADQLNEIDNVNGRWTGALRSRSRGVGGTSRLWGGRTIPVAHTETGPRPYLDNQGWAFPGTDLTPYSSDVENILRLDHSSYEADLFVSREREDPDFDIRWAKWPAFGNLNLAISRRRDVIAHPRVSIWTNATATEFSFDQTNGRLTSVHARHRSGRRLSVTAHRFVIAAGTVESTRLLLLAGRTPGCADLPPNAGLGRYFQDHLNLKVARLLRHHPAQSNALLGYRFVNATRRSLHLELSAKTQADSQVGSAFAYVSIDIEGSALEPVKKLARSLQSGKIDAAGIAALARNGGLVARALIWRYARKRLYVPPSVDLHVELCAEQAPHWDNAIALSNKTDCHGTPLPRINWSPTPADEATLRTSVDRLASFWQRTGWSQICSLSWLPGVKDAPLTDSVVDYYHPSGTTRMGIDKDTSVVSGNLTCHHIPNLSILSASVFPRAGSANPTFTLLRMALRLGDHIADQMGHAR